MMDFFKVVEQSTRRGTTEVYPELISYSSKDIMIRGKSFYAIWDETNNIWSTNEDLVGAVIDEALREYRKSMKTEDQVVVRYLRNYGNGGWSKYKRWLKESVDNYHPLNQKVVFSNTEVTKKDYASRKLPYPIVEGECPAYTELVNHLYAPSEVEKFEWAIGSIIAGDSRTIQKFFVFYGDPGSGKSTIMNIIQQLFDGYWTTFDAKALASNGDSFSLDFFEKDPLIAIQEDGDLSRIEDNTKLNSIVAHEKMRVNAKFKAPYEARPNCMLFMGTNHNVQITDNRSGILRRLIIIEPKNDPLPPDKYFALMDKIPFELGAIASHCLKVYKNLGKNYYNAYRPTEMLEKTNPFYNFMIDNLDEMKDGTSLTQAYSLYKDYCEEANYKTIITKYRFRDELKTYFKYYYPQKWVDGVNIKGRYEELLLHKLGFGESDNKRTSEVGVSVPQNSEVLAKLNDPIDISRSSTITYDWINLREIPSLLDKELADQPAQYTKEDGFPKNKWINVKTTLRDIDTTKLHYTKAPVPHIVVDFDKKDAHGRKSLELNLEAASKFPKTYVELSKSGCGLHLHYLYSGDPNELSTIYDKDIEIKVYQGDASLRRRLTKCNDIPIATISSGLPMKGAKPLAIGAQTIENEKHLVNVIEKALRKETELPYTTPCINLIKKVLDDAYESGIPYDVTYLKPAILDFAYRSTNQAKTCASVVRQMKFQSEAKIKYEVSDKDTLIFYDVEVFPNLFICCWKEAGEGKNVVKMINPTPNEIEFLFQYKLVGFNNRKYDNHILYARAIKHFDNHQLYELSQRIINGDSNAMFGAAYNLSYTDVYDFASAGKKQSLKKFEIELKIHHQENSYPWDQDLDPMHWEEVADYCCNDVIATEAVFNYLHDDFVAREILADIAGMSVNDTTNQLTAAIIFEGNKKPQDQFIYTDLSKYFPGYKFENFVSTYKGIEVGEGGFVYAKWGIYEHVKTFDIASMHPHSIMALNLFGDYYTKRFADLVEARIAIKHKDWGKLKTLFNGAFSKYVSEDNPGNAKALSNALKTAINSVYGLTASRYDVPFRDKRNVDNIVAKRGALFMVDLKEAVEAQGYTVVHIKTDSIKIANADAYIEKFISDFGKKWGYDFEVESEYQKMCLINNAVYVARTEDGEWTATGKQFAVPYVFNTIFAKTATPLSDMAETKSVTTAMYLDMNEQLDPVDIYEEEHDRRRYNKTAPVMSGTKRPKKLNIDLAAFSDEEIDKKIAEGHNYRFVGKVNAFYPIKPGYGGGLLMYKKDEKYNTVVGCKGYRWMEAEYISEAKLDGWIDISYYDELVAKAREAIEEFTDNSWTYEAFIADAPLPERIMFDIASDELPF